MALDLKIESSVLADGSKLLFKDITAQYSALNTGGYGTPNQDRSDIALVFYATKVPFTGEPSIVSTSTSFVDYNPLHTNSYQTVFELPYGKLSDGWYRYYFVALQTENNSPNPDDIIYNPLTEQIEIFNGDEWIQLEEADFDKLINESDPYVFDEELYFLNLIHKFNCLMEQYFTCIQCSTCNCEKQFREIQKLKLLMQSMDYLFNSEKQFEAVKILEKGNKEFANCCK
jgi:hypothetical protein